VAISCAFAIKGPGFADAAGALWRVKDATTTCTPFPACSPFYGHVFYQLNSTDALLRETSATLGNYQHAF
jgi:hypothetical protein